MTALERLTLPELLEQEYRLVREIDALKHQVLDMEAQGLTYRVVYQETAQELKDSRRDLEAVRAQVRRMRGY